MTRYITLDDEARQRVFAGQSELERTVRDAAVVDMLEGGHAAMTALRQRYGVKSVDEALRRHEERIAELFKLFTVIDE